MRRLLYAPRVKAAFLIIGNELLTGKVRDLNLQPLAKMLFASGIALERVVVCRDTTSTIAHELRELRTAFSIVFTSGGIGSTHDDVTIAGVASAFDRHVVHSEQMERTLTELFQHPLSARQKQMARLPEGADVLRAQRPEWPLLRLDNVFILPGVPSLFNKKVIQLRDHLPTLDAFQSVSLALPCGESEAADSVHAVALAFPDVEVGSYPQPPSAPFRVILTFDGKDSTQLLAARDALCEQLPAAWVQKARRDPP